MTNWKKMAAIVVLECFIGSLAAPPFVVLAEPAAPEPLRLGSPSAVSDETFIGLGAAQAIAESPLNMMNLEGVAGRTAAMTAPVRTPQPDVKPLELARKMIGTEGGVLEAEGVRLEVPAGAVAEPTEFVILSLEKTASLNEGMANATLGNRGYRFEPDGARFNRSLTVSLAFDPSLAASETALSNLFTYFYNEETNHWERLLRVGVDRDSFRVISMTSHFTDLINATLKLPEGPQPLQFDVNAIKSLEAANPVTGVPQPEGLEGGVFGSASFKLNFRLPAGRGKAVPELAIRYGSDGGNGILGRGFDLGIPSITTDTRFGLPVYDRRDTYVLEGEELVPQGDAASATLFKPRKEAAFAQVVRAQKDGREYWEVTDKGGTTRVYGTGEAWLGPDRGDPSKVYTWYLSQVRDANGNTVDYAYSYDPEGSYSYLTEVRYSGRVTGEKGPYRIILEYEDRQDRRSDARGKFVSKLTQRVKNVQINYNDTLIRSYRFTYRYDEFGQSQLLSYAERDNQGDVVYTYEFEYYKPETQNDGYRAFGASEEQWGGPSTTYLHQGHTTSIGASLYAGVELWIPWFYFWGIGTLALASFGVKGGFSTSSGITSNSLLDLDGNGLPDLVWKNGNQLQAYFNQGGSFGYGPSWNGLSGLLDYDNQDSFFVGASASIGVVSGEATYQTSWSKAKTSFTDINGDGFPDYVKLGDSGFAMNTGSQFSPQSWSFAQSLQTPSGIGDDEEAGYQRTYYQQEPLRRWTAYRSGTVEVEQDARLESGASADGVVLKTYQGDSTIQAFPLHGDERVTPDESRHAYTVERGKALYFHEDTLADERGDYSQWNVKVRYTQVKLFEDLGDWSVIYNPPPNSENSLPWGDIRLQPIYGSSTSNGVTTYTRKTDWQKYTTDEVCLALLEHGAFVPLRIPVEQFQKMYSRGDSEKMLFTQQEIDDLIKAGVSPTDASKSLFLAAGYYYKPEIKQFLWLPEDDLPLRMTDESTKKVNQALLDLIKKYRAPIAQDLLQALNSSERVELGTYVWLDGRKIFPRAAEGGMYEVPVNAPIVYPAPTLGDPPELGTELPTKGLLVDRYTDPVSGGSAQVWMRSGTVVRDLDGVETTIANPELSISGTDPMTVRYRYDGVLREVVVEGRNALLESLPAWVYEGPLTDALLAQETFSTYGYSTLPAAAWTAIRDAISSQTDKDLFIDSYQQAGEDYQLKTDITAADFQALLRILDERTAQSGCLFGVLPGIPGRQNRLMRLTASEYSAFMTVDGSLTGLFGSYAEGGVTWYYLKSTLTTGERTALHAAMIAWRRDREVFPYYQRSTDGKTWNLRADLTAAQREAVKTLLASLGLAIWTAVKRSFLYRSTDLFPVAKASLPSGAGEVSLAPTDGVTRTVAGSSRIRLPSFDSGGQTIYLPLYLHIFDGGIDFSAVDLTALPEGKLYEDTRPVVPDPFSGGVYGWYYGNWSGYYDWGEALLTKDASKGYDPQKTKGAPPPFFTAAEINTADGKPQIVSTGRDSFAHSVAGDAWIGPVSGYSDVELDETGGFTTVAYTFAAVIQGDQVLATRNGGDTYYKIPRGSVQGAGGSLASIRTSKTQALDINGTISLGGIGGGSLSLNTSQSWEYQALMDLNGDRYPDVVQFQEGGSPNFALLPGTGSGFGAAQSFSGLNSHASYFDNASYGFGATLGVAVGSQMLTVDPSGKMVTVTTNGVQGGGASVGVNGTAGYSVQQEGFIDVNGDGLPDQVRRTGTESYSVALNLGNGSFASPAGWDGGLDMQVIEGLPGLQSLPKGITHSGTGSFGGSVGISIAAGVVGGGISVGYTGTVNQTYSQLLDVNGDGLPDQVGKKADENFFRVRFNWGDQFGPEAKLYRPDWGTTEDELKNAISNDLSSLQIDGFGDPFGLTWPTIRGLPGASDNLFAAAMDPYRVDDVLEYTSGVSYNFGANLTVKFLFPLVALTFTAGVNGSTATSSATLKFTDLDGDGLPDHVLKMPGESFLRVKRNSLGMAGLLKTIMLPQGGTFELAYQRAGNTVAMPQNRWVLASVTKDDGLSSLASDRGAHRIEVSYSYEDGQYDRSEREFWGFAKVTSSFADGSKRIVHYHNLDHFRRGMAYLTEVTGPVGNNPNALLRESRSEIINVPVPSISAKTVSFPAVQWERSRSYEEGRTDRYIETEREYSYDSYGNVSVLKDDGDTATSADDMEASISYATLPGYLKQHPSRIVVEDGAGNLLRQREGSYDGLGNLTELRQWESSGVYHSYLIAWDSYGNLKSITDPRGAAVAWDYDTVVHEYVTTIRQYNALKAGVSYQSSQSWDYALGVPLTKTDQAGETMEYSYDPAGRLTEVWSPYDTGNLPAVSYEYLTNHFPWQAVSENKLTYDPEDESTIVTVITVDGLGRVAQTAKTGEVRAGTDHLVGWNLSGAVKYDEKGRTIAQGQPVFEEGSGLPDLALMKKPTLTAYDALDRVLTVTLPDGAVTESHYALRDGKSLEAVIDPLGRITERLLDGRGNVAEVRKLSKVGMLLTSATYQYNPLGEILTVLDHKGNAVRSEYDLLGRRTRLESPDGGVITYGYDEAGNLSWKQSSVLRSRDDAIRYEYDELNRLVKTDYPTSPDVENVYGGPEAADGGAGRLISRSDGTGTVTYLYGKLGETVGMSRTMKRFTHYQPPITATFRYEWDYLGRMQEVRYPDGEIVLYGYDEGGQIATVTGYHDGYSEIDGLDHWGSWHYWWSHDRGRRWGRGHGWGWYSCLWSRNWGSWWGGHCRHTWSHHHWHRKHPSESFTVTDYVQDIGYDEFGQRVSIDLGNGIETTYTYDENRRWLDTITTKTADAVTLQGIDYSFDLVGNIQGTTNTATAFGKGYSTSTSYAYDDLDQLVVATGSLTKTVDNTYPWRPDGWHTQYTSSYTQSFSFDSLGNMTRKTSTEASTPHDHPWESLDYDLSYQYYAGKAHQAERIGDMWYRYDANGNLAEERRWGHGREPLENPWVKSSGALGMSNRGFGLDTAADTQSEAQQEKTHEGKPGYGDAAGRSYSEREYVWDEENRLVRTEEHGGLTVEYRYGADGQRAAKYSAAGETLYFDSMWTGTVDWPNGWRWSKHIYVGSTRIATRLGYDGHEQDLDYKLVNTYYYHSDHLGSVHLVTDYQGKVYEHIEYTPYGELWVEHGPEGIEAVPYRFTGKELDDETGLYYYGARYLNPRTSRWISADPAIEGYLPEAPVSDEALKKNQNLPGMGGVFNPINLAVYHYGGNNPVRYSDPTGREDTSERLAWLTSQDYVGNISEDLLSQSTYTRPGTAIGTVASVTIHYTGAANQTPKETRDFWEGLASQTSATKNPRYASAHYIIGVDGSILRTVPEGEVANHSGDATGNTSSIAIEMEPINAAGGFDDRTYKAAVQLTASILKEKGLTSSDVKRHYDWNSKVCPKYFVDNPDKWTTFKTDVGIVLDDLNSK